MSEKDTKPKVMSSEKIQVAAFEIILHSGSARTSIHESFDKMRTGNFEEAEKDLQNADEEILKAHQSQTQLLTDYANGTKIDMEIIMVHAQDHLMTTMTLLEVAREMEFLYKKVLDK